MLGQQFGLPALVRCACARVESLESIVVPSQQDLVGVQHRRGRRTRRRAALCELALEIRDLIEDLFACDGRLGHDVVFLAANRGGHVSETTVRVCPRFVTRL